MVSEDKPLVVSYDRILFGHFYSFFSYHKCILVLSKLSLRKRVQHDDRDKLLDYKGNYYKTARNAFMVAGVPAPPPPLKWLESQVSTFAMSYYWQ